SSKNLDELLNSQMSARDKTGLGYGTQLNKMSNKSKTDGNFLTPRADISFAGKTNEANTQKPKTIYESVNRDKVIIEDWNSDDEDNVSEVQTINPVKTNDQIGQTSKKAGIGFKKIKACFVCKSTNHLIKDCNFHDKQSQEPKLKNMVNTSPRVVKPVWDNAKRVNHQKFSNKLNYPQARKTFVPSGVLTRTGLITPFKQNEKRAVHKVSTSRPVSTARPISNTRPVSTVRPDSTGNLKILLQDHTVVDSGCSSHMTGNKAYLSDYEDYNGGFVVLEVIPKEVRVKLHIKKPSEGSPKDNDVQDLEDVVDKEGQHQITEDKQVLHDELEKMIAQEVVAKALDDATRQAFEEEKRNIASQKRGAQTTSINKLSTSRSYVSTATTPYVSAASTPTGANASESSFLYLGGKIPIDAYTLPNARLPIDPNMPDLEDDSDAFSSDGIFNGTYDGENVGVVANFNNMDDTINVSHIPILRIHKNHPKAQILGDPKSAVQTRGKIQKASLFKLQKVWIPVDLPSGKKAIGTKWVFKNKRYERSIVVKNKARLVAQGFRQEEGIDYDKVFTPVARIEAIRLFLAFASYMGFIVYQMDVKSAFLYGTIEEEVYVHQPPGFFDPAHPNKVYKVIKALYGLHQAPRVWYETLSSFMMENGFRRATTPIESNKPLVKDEDGEDVDVHVYISMISSLMYLTTSRPDIMFAICACARFQVTPKASHLNAVKRIFRYLKHQPKLGLWYPGDSPFELEAFSDSDYGGANLDRKSTTEYVAAANCCGQVLWIQNQIMDYGFNVMNTIIHIDNECTISVIKNPVAHSRTKHIEIRFHFTKDCYEKRLIEVIKIYTDSNVADLLTKGFDVIRFNFLVVSIGMLNL
ncbi:putative reverse transcriptase, RNA-dependent DNA polymerase, partial [Tanacetum coccineum]